MGPAINRSTVVAQQSLEELDQLSAAIFEELYLIKSSVKSSEVATSELFRRQVFPASCRQLMWTVLKNKESYAF